MYEDESSRRLTDPDDNVYIEIKRARVPQPLDNLAIHYPALFPGGEVIRSEDSEEYVTINGRNAYKVVFQPKYVRKRKRVTAPGEREKDESTPGWIKKTILDPGTGAEVSVLFGPVVPRHRILYLVQGDKYIYYVFMRVDGDSMKSAYEKFDKLLRENLRYE